MKTMSESAFVNRLAEIFRELEKTGEEVVVTENGEMVLKLLSYHREVTHDDLRLAQYS
jgi:hypothetical protein